MAATLSPVSGTPYRRRRPETTALYDACASRHKRHHIFQGGHHRPSIRDFPEESRETLRRFLTEDAGCVLPPEAPARPAALP